jgi:hypothetical protein
MIEINSMGTFIGGVVERGGIKVIGVGKIKGRGERDRIIGGRREGIDRWVEGDLLGRIIRK